MMLHRFLLDRVANLLDSFNLHLEERGLGQFLVGKERTPLRLNVLQLLHKVMNGMRLLELVMRHPHFFDLLVDRLMLAGQQVLNFTRLLLLARLLCLLFFLFLFDHTVTLLFCGFLSIFGDFLLLGLHD